MVGVPDSTALTDEGTEVGQWEPDLEQKQAVIPHSFPHYGHHQAKLPEREARLHSGPQ